MLSRIFWVGIAGIALIAGMAIQDRDWIFGWDDHDVAVERAIEADVERTVNAEIERAVQGSFDGMEVTGPDGREIDATPEAKRALAAAVGRLLKAEGRVAAVRIGDGTSEELQAAKAARDHARADVDRLKAEIERQDEASGIDRDALRDQIRREVREDIRDTVRAAVRN